MAALFALTTVSACISISQNAPDAGGPAGSGPSNGSPATTHASPRPDTPWDTELRQVNPDGTRSADSALRLFAMAYGPVPGVDDVPQLATRVEGTIARRAVMAHYDELTADQQAAVDAAFAPDPNADVVEIGPVAQSTTGGSTGGLADADAVSFVTADLTPLEQAIADATNEYRAAIAAKIGDIPGEIKLSFPKEQRPDALADTDGVWTSGSYGGCEINWYVAGLTDDPLNMLLTAAHETFHCFQAAAINNKQRYYAAPDWYLEGGAEWVSYVIAGAPQDGGFWDDYVDDPAIPLFQRTYDGLGFFADLAATGIDPWDKWKAMWSGYTNEAAWTASGAEADAFLDSWSSGWFRDPARGVDWDMTGPGIPPSEATPGQLSVGNGTNASFTAPAYANSQYKATSAADVIVITGTGHVRISDGSVDETMPIGQHFCTKDGGCNCPDGDPPPFAVTNLAATFDVAVTGGSTGASGAIAGISLEDACKKETPSPSQAVKVTIDRPALEGVLPGTVVDLTSCDGPYGTWKGVFRTGGLSEGGFEVPFTDLSVQFTMPAQGGTQVATTTTSATVVTPIGDVPLDYNVTVTVTGGTMTIVLDPGSDDLDNKLVNMPIVPAPEGTCP